MNISKTLQSLEKSWSREKVLQKIKNGVNSENIVNDFFRDNQENLEDLSFLLKPKDKELLNHIEELSNCESILINKIINLDKKQLNISFKKKPLNWNSSTKKSFSRFSSFMMKWSNQFVVISLIILSAIALSKQAWS